MMKIKILQPIPGYKAGEQTYAQERPDLMGWGHFFGRNYHLYCAEELAKDGIVQIMPDIEIESIRKELHIEFMEDLDMAYFDEDIRPELTECDDEEDNELPVLTALRVVNRVIQELDKDVKDNSEKHYEIGMVRTSKKLELRNVNGKHLKLSFLPNCTRQTAIDTILLCEPELKLLFNIS